MASLSCRCGGVDIRLTTTKPKNSFECCCVDCYSKVVWSCTAGGVPCPLPAHGAGTPLVLAYYDNNLEVLRGKEKLAFNRLRPGSDSTNMVASCCKSLLCVDHPFYEGKCILLFPQFCPLRDATTTNHPLLDLPEPPCRVFVKDWPSGAYAKLPPKAGVWRENGKTMGASGGDVAVMRECAGNMHAPMRAGLGNTFRELLSAEGGEVEVLGLCEGDNSMSKKAGAGR